MRCYIAGPMRSVEGFNYPAFFAAEKRLREAGWAEVWNPARMDGGEAPTNLTLEEQKIHASDPEKARRYADRDLHIIKNVLRAEEGDAVVVLPDWEDSQGAVAEIGVARWVGLPVLTLDQATSARSYMLIKMVNEARAEAATDGPGELYPTPPAMHVEPHHFHPVEDVGVCGKCGEGHHGLKTGVTPVKPYAYGEEREKFWTDPVCVSTEEQKLVLDCFTQLLKAVTADGGRKRAAGTKPPWTEDVHLPAVFSHISKLMHDELSDVDSGAHPGVHAAWRLLAIAYQETVGLGVPAAEGLDRLRERGR